MSEQETTPITTFSTDQSGPHFTSLKMECTNCHFPREVTKPCRNCGAPHFETSAPPTRYMPYVGELILNEGNKLFIGDGKGGMIDASNAQAMATLIKERDQLRAESARLQALDAARAEEVDAVNARLIETRKERDEARADVERLWALNARRVEENKKTRAEVERLRTSRPEPSRLEIAAQFYAAGYGPVEDALKRADALIAAAKEKPVA